VSSGDASMRGDKAYSALHNLEYDRWLKVMCTVLPEFKPLFTGDYGPRLLASDATAEAEAAAKGKPVNFMRWLDRFQVVLAIETYGDFKRDVLTRVFEQLKEKTRSMSMTQVLGYFDANNDGAMRMKDIVAVLQDLNLGLPERQLEQLVYELGFVDKDEEVEPVEVLTMLVHGLANFQRAQSSVEIGEREIEDRASQQESAGKLEAMRGMIQANKSKVRDAFNGESISALFLKGDSDGDGYLSYEETKKILQNLMTVCGSDICTEEDLMKLIQYIDLGKDGNITFVEFIAAFGLSDAQRGNFVDISSSGDISSHLADEMMQQICSALYERSHALHRAFTYLDDRGDGWIEKGDFEEALMLVLASGSAEDKNKGLLMAPQVKDLVTCVAKSHLANPGKDPVEVDYNEFIQSFRVIDTVLEPEGAPMLTPN